MSGCVVAGLVRFCFVALVCLMKPFLPKRKRKEKGCKKSLIATSRRNVWEQHLEGSHAFRVFA